jgi:hypothetical protein
VSGKDSIALATALDEVVKWAQVNFGGVHSRAELHAHDLVGGQKDWEQYRNDIPAWARVWGKLGAGVIKEASCWRW